MSLPGLARRWIIGTIVNRTAGFTQFAFALLGLLGQAGRVDTLVIGNRQRP